MNAEQEMATADGLGADPLTAATASAARVVFHPEATEQERGDGVASLLRLVADLEHPAILEVAVYEDLKEVELSDPAEPLGSGGPRFGEVWLEPFEPDPETGEAPEGVCRLDRLPDGVLFEDAVGDLFNVVRQGPTQGSTEIVDDSGTHAFFDCGALVRLHTDQRAAGSHSDKKI